MSRSRRIRLYVDATIKVDSEIVLTSEQMHYLMNVMRCSEDDHIKVFNGKEGEWEAVIGKRTVTPTRQLREPENVSKQILLCFAPTKKYGEFTAEKATEMSVSGIIPLKCEHSVVTKINFEKYKKTTVEAAEQCQRITLPTLLDMTPLMNLERVIKTAYPNKKHLFIICDFNANKIFNHDQIKELTADAEVLSIIIGPEGGFSPRDHACFHSFTEKTVYMKLCSSILRAETACIAAVALCRSWIDQSF